MSCAIVSRPAPVTSSSAHGSNRLFPENPALIRQDLLLVSQDRLLVPQDLLLIPDDDSLVSDDRALILERRLCHFGFLFGLRCHL
jgi:hypothetical protein